VCSSLARNLKEALAKAGIDSQPAQDPQSATAADAAPGAPRKRRKSKKPKEPSRADQAAWDSARAAAAKARAAGEPRQKASERDGKPTITRRIAPEEVEPGVVVRLDPARLLRDSRVVHTQDPPTPRAGPFVCVKVDGDLTTWAGLTGQGRHERLRIDEKWRLGGWSRWSREWGDDGSGGQYLTDAANLWIGPRETFSAASRQPQFDREDQARISEEGVLAILVEIARNRHRRHRCWED
jgi:hypothetical protein